MADPARRPGPRRTAGPGRALLTLLLLAPGCGPAPEPTSHARVTGSTTLDLGPALYADVTVTCGGRTSSTRSDDFGDFDLIVEIPDSALDDGSADCSLRSEMLAFSTTRELTLQFGDTSQVAPTRDVGSLSLDPPPG